MKILQYSVCAVSNYNYSYNFLFPVLFYFINIDHLQFHIQTSHLHILTLLIIMSALTQKFSSVKLPKHLFAYCMSFMLYGFAMTGIGPWIPYLSHRTGHIQTDYTFLFFCRSIGFFCGSFLLKQLQKKLTFHSILLGSSLLLCIFMIIFTFTYNFMIQGLLMLIISAITSIINIVINVCVTQTQKYGDGQFWLHILHVMYGIGGLLSPFLIYMVGLYSYLILGLLIAALSPLYYILPSPQIKLKYRLEVYASIQFVENQNQNQNKLQQAILLKRKFLGKQSENILCFLFLIYIGIQLGFGNWISSYAVMKNIDTKESALKYTSIFWGAMTLFRFLLPFMPFKPMKKMFFLQYVLMIFVMISLLLIINQKGSIACILSSLTYGMCFSSMYPLLLSIPLDYGLQISSIQMANIAIWSAIGQATISSSFGLFMQWISKDMLFYIIFVLMIVFIFATYYLQELYQKQSKKNKMIEMEQMSKHETRT